MMKNLKFVLFTPMFILPLCSFAAERPSLTTHELRIGELETKTTELHLQDTQIQQQVESLNQQLSNILVTPGPKGDTGDKGEKGDRGAQGEPGPLSDLSCNSGQIAIFDGANWLCADGPDIAESLENDNCITGFIMSLTIDGNTIQNLDQKCEEDNSVVVFSGPLLTRRSSISSAPVLQMFAGQFDNNLIEFRSEPLTLPRSSIFNGDLLAIRVTVVSLNSTFTTNVQDWASGRDRDPRGFILTQADSELRIEADFCIPESYSAKPVTIGRGSIKIVEQLSFFCGGNAEFEIGSNAGINDLLNVYTSNRSTTEELTLEFADAALNGFNQTLVEQAFFEFQLPNFRAVINQQSSVLNWLVNSRFTFKFKKQSLF